MGIFVTYADNSFLSREYHPEQRVLKPSFDFLPHMVPQGPQSLTPKWHFFKILAVSIIGIRKDVVIDMCGQYTDVYNNIFFYSDNRNSQNL